MIRHAWEDTNRSVRSVLNKIKEELSMADFILPKEWSSEDGLEAIRDLEEYPDLKQYLLEVRWDHTRSSVNKLTDALGLLGETLADFEGRPGESLDETRHRWAVIQVKANWRKVAEHVKTALFCVAESRRDMEEAERESVKNRLGPSLVEDLARDARIANRALGQKLEAQRKQNLDPPIIELSSRESFSSGLAEEAGQPAIIERDNEGEGLKTDGGDTTALKQCEVGPIEE